ncbi:MAG: Flp pilus assembly protein CpaB [Pseudomonadota bacterium]
MKYLPAISLGLSVILGVLAFFVLRMEPAKTETVEPNPVREVSAAAPVQTVSVLVVSETVEMGAPVLPEAVETRDWPSDLVPEGALMAMRDIRSANGEPRFAQVELMPGEPLLATKIADTPPRRMLSRDIPAGYRAVSISVTNVTNVAGFVLPGDRVDMMAYIPVPGATGPDAFRARPLVENVLVLGVDQFMGASVEGAVPASLVTFALKPDDAQRITAAARESRIGLALIGQAEVDAQEAEETKDAEEVTPVAAQPSPRPRRRAPVRRAAPVPATRPETTQVRVVHGANIATVTAPVEEEPAPVDLMKGAAQ